MRRRLCGDDVTVLGAAALFVVSSLLPWYATRFQPVAQGIDPPYAGLVELAVLAAASMAADVVLAAVRGSSVLAPGLRGRVHLALGCGVLGVVGFKYLSVTDGARQGLWLAMASAAALAYEGYLRHWETQTSPGRPDGQ